MPQPWPEPARPITALATTLLPSVICKLRSTPILLMPTPDNFSHRRKRFCVPVRSTVIFRTPNVIAASLLPSPERNNASRNVLSRRVSTSLPVPAPCLPRHPSLLFSPAGRLQSQISSVSGLPQKLLCPTSSWTLFSKSNNRQQLFVARRRASISHCF